MLYGYLPGGSSTLIPPNFYKIDCEREVVLQGKTSTFITITRNDEQIGDSPNVNQMPPELDLVIIAYPQPNTFETHAVVQVTCNRIGINTIKCTYVTPFPFGDPTYPSGNDYNEPRFRRVSDGLIVKNWYNVVSGLSITDAPLEVKNSTPSGFELSAKTGLWSLITTSAISIEVGTYDGIDGDTWKINGGNTNIQLNTLNVQTPPLWQPYDGTIPNPFDGSGGAGPITYGEDTGFFGRLKPFWVTIPYSSVNTTTNGATFRIDYDGTTNSHLKLNFLIGTTLPSTISTTKLFDGITSSEPFGVKGNYYVYGPDDGNRLDYQEIHLFGYTEDYVRPSRDNNSVHYPIVDSINDDKASYALIKTNPKISGNVKLTVDSTGEIWLNSFNANDELSDSSYKKFPISSSSTYQRDLYDFFKKGQTPTNIVFDVYEVDDQYLNTKRTYDLQFDNFYNYGVEQLRSKFYDENFTFLSPIWLRKDVPDYFVIFRVDHPINPESYFNSDTETKFNDYFKDARIVKTFDLRSTSKIGSYLRKLVNDARWKERPLEVSWESDTATYWNGIAYQNGTIAAKGEFLYDYYNVDRPIKDFEEYITDGFQRNGIISSNLINLEFLFDDDEAPLYGINRYFGFYVTENQLAEFEIEPSVLGKIANQTPSPKPKVDGEPYSTRPFVQTNPDGIQIPVHYYHSTAYTNNTSNIPDYQGFVLGKFPLPSMVDDPLRFFYIKDRNDIFKRVNKLTEVNYGMPGASDYVRATQLQLFDNQEDISSYAGVSEIVSQFPAKLLDSGKAQLRIHLFDQKGTGVLADDEELIIEVKKYNDSFRKNTYYIQVTDVTSTSVTVEYVMNHDIQQLTSSFVQPAVNDIVTVDVLDPTIYTAGEQIYIINGGFYRVAEIIQPPIGDPTQMKLINLGYPKNVAPPTVFGDTIASSNIITNVYPMPTTTGDIIAGPGIPAGTTVLALGVSSITISNNATLSQTNTAFHIGTVTVPSGSIITDAINSFSGDATYHLNGGSFKLSIDNYLTINLSDFGIGYSIGDAWKVDADFPTLVKTVLNGGLGIDAIYTPQYQQFTWRLTANGTGLQAGDSWDYPTNDPNGTDYISNFSNEGTASDVAKAISKCINSFENIPVKACAIDDTVYMISNLLDEEGNSLHFTRKLKTNSVYANLGFYERGNSIKDIKIEQKTFSPLSNIDLNEIIIEYPDTPVSKGFYLSITRGTTVNTAIGKQNADLSTYASATSTGTTIWKTFTGNTFKCDGVPFSLDISNVEVGAIIEVAYQVTSTDINEQYFVGGVKRKRNRAKIALADGQKYYSDRRTSRIGSTITSSNIVTVDTTDVFVGAPIRGLGIPANTTVTDVNATTLTISNAATSTNTSVTLNIGELSILNNNIIYQQWYQAQKGIYSRMKSWEVQGKLIYSLPYLDEPLYDDNEYLSGFTGYADNSIIQLEDTSQEFFMSIDNRIVAYKVYRPTFGIFSVYPVKEFDFDFILSEYSYTPTIEALPYFFKETISNDSTIELPIYENFVLTQSNKPYNSNYYRLMIQVLNNGTWYDVETLTITSNDVVSEASILFNTFYPMYDYDELEYPFMSVDSAYNTPASPYNKIYQYRGAGKRNFDRRYLRTLNPVTNQEVKFYPEKFRIKYLPNTTTDTLTIQNFNYKEDRDLSLFNGFAGLQDIEGAQDASVIQTLKEEGKFVDAFAYQLLRSEYDRLRENADKEFAVKSKVVPYIAKWVQEGTDARDNYYRLNNSLAFGVNNLSPNDQIDFAETSVLTQEFPYLDSFPKNYPDASLESSRSYMFARLNDIAYDGKTWYELLSSNDDVDWFAKYFSLGYPTEETYTNSKVPKSRDERYTFFNYNNGLGKSQTLFRGAKVQPIVYTDRPDVIFTGFIDNNVLYVTAINYGVLQLGQTIVGPGISSGTVITEFGGGEGGIGTYEVNISQITTSDTLQAFSDSSITEVENSTSFDGYKFAAIARFNKPSAFTKEKPVDLEFIKNDKFKTVVLIITVHVDDYRLQHGHTDYMSQYFMTDILKNSNQKQYKFNPATLTSKTFRNFYPYRPWPYNLHYFNSIVRPRQGFLGGGYLQLGNKKLGGIVDFTIAPPAYTTPNLSLYLKTVDPTYLFNLQTEQTTIINNYRDNGLNIYNNDTILPIKSAEYGKNGFLFNFHTTLTPTSDKFIMKSLISDQETGVTLLPLFARFGSNQKTINFKVGSVLGNGTYSVPEHGLNPFNVNVTNLTGSPHESATVVIEGGTQGYESIKNYLTFGNLKTLINSTSNYIEYYKVVNNKKESTKDYNIRLISGDTIIKTNVLHYAEDTDKPQEYADVNLIGYNTVNTNMQEYLVRHRGYYEPKTKDLINFWLREDNEFTNHFEKDFLLSNTHINGKSAFSGLIRNYGINKVAVQGEVLKISRDSAYKSLYPLIGEVAVDNMPCFTLNSSWDKDFYRNYLTTTSYENVNGILEMKETKSFLASKVMNVPKSHELHTFTETEVTYVLDAPATGIGVNNLITNTSANNQNKQNANKPKLTINIDVRSRLLRQLIEDIDSGLYEDEFNNLTSYNVLPLSALTPEEIRKMKISYLEKNIINLYEVKEITLYVLVKEGIDIVNLDLTEADKASSGYKVDKDCVVKTITDFTYEITKILDPKVPSGFSLSTMVKRV